MDLIDENGNLFGAVNVIDALAILLILAVIVAGVAVAGSLSAEETADESPDERYVTIDFGGESLSFAEAVSEGDELTVGDGSDQLTVTDVYAVPVSSGSADITLRAQFVGQNANEISSGQNISVEADGSSATGSIESVDDSGSELNTTHTEVLFEQIVSLETATQIQASDESKVANETVGTVETRSVYPEGNDQYRVVAGATLTTLERDDNLLYGHASVESDSTIAFATETYALDPTVLETGTTTEPGELTTTTVEIDLNELSQREADQFEPGLTETAGGESWATIVDIDREPASVVIETDDGDLYERQHPSRDDLTLTVELQTRQTDLGLGFKGDSFENGDTVHLDFGVTTIEERAWIVD